LNNYFIK